MLLTFLYYPYMCCTVKGMSRNTCCEFHFFFTIDAISRNIHLSLLHFHGAGERQWR